MSHQLHTNQVAFIIDKISGFDMFGPTEGLVRTTNMVPKLIVIMTSLVLLGFVRWGTKPFMDFVSS